MTLTNKELEDIIRLLPPDGARVMLARAALEARKQRDEMATYLDAAVGKLRRRELLNVNDGVHDALARYAAVKEAESE